LSEAKQRTETTGTVGLGVPWTLIELSEGRHAVPFGDPGLARSDLCPVWPGVIESPSVGPQLYRVWAHEEDHAWVCGTTCRNVHCQKNGYTLRAIHSHLPDCVTALFQLVLSHPPKGSM